MLLTVSTTKLPVQLWQQCMFAGIEDRLLGSGQVRKWLWCVRGRNVEAPGFGRRQNGEEEVGLLAPPEIAGTHLRRSTEGLGFPEINGNESSLI